MDKKNLIILVAITAVLGLLVTFGLPLLQGRNPFAPQQAASPLPVAASPAPAPTPASPIVPASQTADSGKQAADKAAAGGLKATIPAATPAPVEAQYTIRTDLVTAVFTNKGGELVSLKLNKHLDKGQPVEMVMKGDSGSYFFGTSFGDYGTPASREVMNAKMPDDKTIEFSYDYAAPGTPGQTLPFTFKKRFSFRPGEYMFELQVSIENSVNAVPNVNNKGYAYTLFLGPQIGPNFKSISTYDESRAYRVYANGKVSGVSVGKNSVKTVKDSPVWSAVVGKYFSLIAVAGGGTPYTVIYNTNAVPGVPATSQMSLSRPPVSSSATVDTIRFYMGPNEEKELKRYNDKAKNSFSYSGLKIDQIRSSNPLFGWLEPVLKWMLDLFYAIVRNYGVAIMLVTLVIKILFFPLSLKSSISMAKMSELQPKIQELQAKYKDKPEKLNQEMMDFYKKEGANPLSGCLPMLIQIPIFFAMYSLFNTNFDLHGALFIPGWIADLSKPDSVLNFNGFNIFGLDFSAIRILPIVYVISQLFYGKYTQMSQPTPGQNATQMKIMLYGMPIFFFFILYNACAGLLVYWITQNVLTIAQQVITNRIIHQRKQRRS